MNTQESAVQGENIASRWTRAYKWVAPAGYVIGIATMMLANGGSFAMWLLLLGGVVVFMSFRELADEVIDEGDVLRVRQGKRETRIELGRIASVDQSKLVYPPLVTLRLTEPAAGMEKVEFLPRAVGRSGPRRGTPEDLIARVMVVRRRAGLP